MLVSVLTLVGAALTALLPYPPTEATLSATAETWHATADTSVPENANQVSEHAQTRASFMGRSYHRCYGLVCKTLCIYNIIWSYSHFRHIIRPCSSALAGNSVTPPQSRFLICQLYAVVVCFLHTWFILEYLNADTISSNLFLFFF